MKKSSNGFSLIELLIVVAIILIIAAIAIPDLLRSKVAANQASAVGSLRVLNTSEFTYSATFNIGYSSALSYLDGSGTPTSTAAGLIDSVLGGSGDTSTKSTYTFTYCPCATAVASGALCTTGTIGTAPCGPGTNTQVITYAFDAVPQAGAGTGNGNCYFTDTSGVIRQNNTTIAGVGDSPLAG